MSTLINYLYQISDFNLFVLLSSFFIIISIFALYFIRAFIPLHVRYQENAVIGCTSALIVVIYGVLAGFATSYLINSNNYAADALQREANSIANLYRDSRALHEPLRGHIQKDIKRYLDEVVNVEWPLMHYGNEVTDVGSFILQDLLDELNAANSKTTAETVATADMLMVMRNIYDAREQRIILSYRSLSNEVWVVIIIGTILTLVVSYLFGINFYLHVFVVVAAALMAASILFLLISLDKPFQGDFVVGPEIYQAVLAFIDKN